MNNNKETNKKKKDQLKSDLLLALQRNMGVVTPSCKAVNCSRQTYYRYMECPKFARSVADVLEERKDFGESQLLKLMTGVKVLAPNGEYVYEIPPNARLVMKFNMTINRDRGYVERTEIAGVSEQPLFPEIDYDIPKDDSD